MTIDEIKLYTVIAFQLINMVVSSALWLYVRYGDRNKQVDARIEGIRKEIDDRMDHQESQIARLQGLTERAPTHEDLAKIYDKINATANSMAEMSGQVRAMNENLQLILNRIARDLR